MILKEIKKLRRSEPREPQYITGSEDNTNSTLDVSSIHLLSNFSAHSSANASNLAPPLDFDPNPPHDSNVTTANVSDLAPSHIHDPAPLTLVIAGEVPKRTAESFPKHGLSNLVTSDFSGLELGTVVSLDDIVVIPFQASTPKNRNLSPKSLVPIEISSSLKPDSNNVPLCTEQIHQIQITDEPVSLETCTELVPSSRPKEQLGSEQTDTETVTLSQMPTSKVNLPLCTVTATEKSEKENEILTFGVTPQQREGRSLLSLDDVTVIPTMSEHSDSHDVLPKKSSSSTITSASTNNKKSIDPNTVFEQHLFIPKPLKKSKQNIPKARIPSAISGKKWREYHLLKEKAKQEKNEEKEKAKEAKKQAVKRKQEETKKNKEKNKAKKLNKGKLLTTTELTSKQNCGQCANILNSDTEDDENKNVGCDFCTKWFHLKCTDFIGLTYDDVKDKPFKCNMCIMDP